jgi:RHS repeat-associated protein
MPPTLTEEYPFGDLYSQSGTGNMLLRFPGQYDEGNNIYQNVWRFYFSKIGRYSQPDPLHNRANYYNQLPGRFSGQDPVGFDGGTNFYSYVSNDPLLSFDPFGLCDVQVRCRRIRGDKRWEKIASSAGMHCYILATDRNGNFLQISAGATPDRSRSVSGSGPQSKGTEPQYQCDKCINCDNGRPMDATCEKVDCLVKKAKEYNGFYFA